VLVQNIGVQVKKVEVLVEKIQSDDMEDLLSDATISDYFANSCEKQVFLECDVEFLEKTSQEVPMFRKRKALDDSCLSQLKRRRLSTIAENADEFSLEGEPVYEFVAEYDESSKMFIQEGRKIDLTSLIGNLSNQKEMPLDKEEFSGTQLAPADSDSDSVKMASLEQNCHAIHNFHNLLHPPHHLHKNNVVLIQASKYSVKATSRLQSTLVLVMNLFTIGFGSSYAC